VSSNGLTTGGRIKSPSPGRTSGSWNPYAIHADLQDCMQLNVGLIRVEKELLQALDVIASLKARLENVSVPGSRQYNPGWHMALDLHNMLRVAECCTLAAMERKESRGGHTRDDYPATEADWGKWNIVIRPARDGELTLVKEPLPQMPPDLQELFQEEAH